MIGLVVINYNDYINTISFINSVKGYNCIKHIVIVDNCSTDGSYDELSKIVDDKVILIKNVSNKGYGSGINLGSKYLIDNFDVDFIIVSNTDIIVNSEGDVKRLVSFFSDDIALIGPKILENGSVNRGWKVPSAFDDALLNIPVIHRWLRKKLLFYNDRYYNDEFSIVDVVSGCFFIIRADVLKNVGFYDENVFLYYEENIMAVKLLRNGFRSLIVNDVSVIHNHSVTIDNSLSRIRKYKALKKSQMYFHKVYSNGSFFSRLFLYLTDKVMLLLLYLVAFFKGGNK